MDLKIRCWIIYAKRDGVCKETGKPIKIGDVVLYLPPVKGICGGRVFCKESEEFKRAVKNTAHTGWKIDEDEEI